MTSGTNNLAPVSFLSRLTYTYCSFFSQVDSKAIDRDATIPDSILQNCKDMGIFGQRADPVFGGLGMNALESTRVAEAMSYDPSLFATVTAHEALGMKVRFEIIASALSNPPRLPSPLWK